MKTSTTYTLEQVQKLVNESRLQLKSNGEVIQGTVALVHAFDKLSLQHRDAFSMQVGKKRRFYWTDQIEHFFNIL